MQKRKTRVGYVVSDKMDKTVIVAVQALRHHILYRKAFKHIKRYKAHDENNACKVGDKVMIGEARPLSRGKRWRLLEVISGKELADKDRSS
ncbi:MAG: 30S ribosomal protein S17 [Chloroflexota bacterium]|nr:30S ribosomal protein S17 [Chloroflexota bacterium]